MNWIFNLFFLLNFMSCFDKMQELSVPYIGNVHKPPGIWAGAQRGPLSASHHFAFLIVAVSVSFYIFSFEGEKKRRCRENEVEQQRTNTWLWKAFFFPLSICQSHQGYNSEGKKSRREVILQTWNFPDFFPHFILSWGVLLMEKCEGGQMGYIFQSHYI